MKYSAAILLFLFFTACISAVKFADNYSRLYVQCASAVVSEIKTLASYPAETAALIEKLSGHTERQVSDKVCPALRPEHQDVLTSLIENSHHANIPDLRGAITAP